MRVRLFNDFHRTDAVVIADADKIISARALKRAERKLCGMKTCKCGGIRGPGNPELEPLQNGDYRIFRLWTERPQVPSL